MSPKIQVSIVTYNSAPHLQACLQSLRAQTARDFAVSLWDNASGDESLQIIAENQDWIQSTHFSTRNIGFCAAQNRLIAEADTEYVLALNPDVTLDARFMEMLACALDCDATAGAASGKLWRWNTGEPPQLPGGRILDTTGMYFTPSQRHLDRGAGEPDLGQYDRREYVFGASGAAAFYRRKMLDELTAAHEYFDEAFFAYREDADLAWRAQWLGWRCLYVPEATGFHVRRVLPERRAALPPGINMHSFKNRFLLRIRNMDLGTYARFILPITGRDLAAFGYVLLKERSSLEAIPLLFRSLPKSLAARRALRRHRRVSPKAIRAWFAFRPVSKPADCREPVRES